MICSFVSVDSANERDAESDACTVGGDETKWWTGAQRSQQLKLEAAAGSSGWSYSRTGYRSSLLPPSTIAVNEFDSCTEIILSYTDRLDKRCGFNSVALRGGVNFVSLMTHSSILAE
jgi:hypothetical protein